MQENRLSGNNVSSRSVEELQVDQPVERTGQSVERDDASWSTFVAKVGLLVSVLLAAQFLLPTIVESVQYAAVRGKQRAEFDVAGEFLRDRPLDQLSLAYQSLSQRVSPSVVHIDATGSSDAALQDEMMHLFGSPRQRQGNRQDANQGSGVIVSTDGEILTNLHVVHGTTRIVVTLTDGRRNEASIVGVDRLTDLAVLKIDATDLIPARWGDSDRLEEGALVWAIGSPFGFQHSITSGIVSAKNRSNRAGTAFQDFLQTDAAVNPGNSGGPLVDAAGNVVGINTMIVGPTFQGISLAIPSNVAQAVYRKLIEDGRVERGWLGVRLRQNTPELAQQMRLSQTQGAIVRQLVSVAGRSPAGQAGIQPDDVIVEWASQPIHTTAALSRAIAETTVGQDVELVVIRDGVRLPLVVTVGERPSEYN